MTKKKFCRLQEVFSLSGLIFLFSLADWLKLCLAPFSRSPSFCLPFFSTLRLLFLLHPSVHLALRAPATIPHSYTFSSTLPHLLSSAEVFLMRRASRQAIPLFHYSVILRLDYSGSRSHTQKNCTRTHTHIHMHANKCPLPPPVTSPVQIRSSSLVSPQNTLDLSLRELSWTCPSDNDVTLQLVRLQQCRRSGK